TIPIKMLRSQRRGRDPPCWLSEKEPLVGKRRVNFQRCWLPVSRIGLHRRGVERVNCGPKLLDLGEKGVYSSYTSPGQESGPYPPSGQDGRGHPDPAFWIGAQSECSLPHAVSRRCVCRAIPRLSAFPLGQGADQPRAH